MKLFPLSIAVFAAALFGVTTPISKLLLQNLSPLLLAGFLYLGAGIGLIPFVVTRKKLSGINKLNCQNTGRILGAIVLGGMVGPVFLLWGLKFASAASVSLWLNLELIATAVLGYLFFKDYLGRNGWIGVGGVLGAGVLLTINEGASGIVAALLVSMACICWALDNHFTALIDGITPAVSTFLKGVVAGSVNIVLGSFAGNATYSFGVTILAIMVGSLCFGLSILLYITAAQRIGATRSQIIFSSAPFFGLLFSVVLLNESLSLLQLVAVVILVGSIFLIAREKHEHYHEHKAFDHVHLHQHDDIHHTHDHPRYLEALNHVHLHKHGEISHSHPHWPDIHHRHKHGNKL